MKVKPIVVHVFFNISEVAFFLIVFYEKTYFNFAYLMKLSNILIIFMSMFALKEEKFEGILKLSKKKLGF
jgi:hypothetical protein